MLYDGHSHESRICMELPLLLQPGMAQARVLAMAEEHL